MKQTLADKPSAASDRSPVWRCRNYEFELSRPLVMGILNVTPDSFSDGGQHQSEQNAIAFGHKLIEDGADILDVGGESTRPGSKSPSTDEESRRIIGVVQTLAKETRIPVSVDTRNPVVARQALESGASIINDITGLQDPEMRAVVRDFGAGAVLMHMQGEPSTMQAAPVYENVVEEVYAWLQQRIDEVISAGIDVASLAIDPGIGFGKTSAHNLSLLGSLQRFSVMGPPLLVGLSRKRFIGEITGAPVDQRLAGSLTALVWCIWRGASILRVHDVKESVAAVRMATSLAGVG